MPKISVLIVDDHPFFVHGLERYLSSVGRFDVTSALSVDEAFEKLEGELPRVIIMDISMANGGGMTMLREIKERQLPMKTMFLTVQIDPEDTLEALRLGIDGIALKERDPQEIITAIDHILAGGQSVDPAVLESALRFSASHPTPTLRQDDLLTPRESEVVDLVCRGMRNREIATTLNLTEGTIKVHLHSIYRKLAVSSRAELIIKKGGLMARS